MNEKLIISLDRLALLAKGPRTGRFLNKPGSYLFGYAFRKWIYPFRKRGKSVTCKTFFGDNMHLNLPAGMDIFLIGAKSHDSEIRLARFLLSHLHPGQSFIDVGAHFGYYTLLASKLTGKTGMVVSIEPSRSNFEVLLKNTQVKDNISIHNIACADNDRTVSFYEFPVLYSEYNTQSPAQFNDSTWIEKNKPIKYQIPATTLDLLLEEHNVHPDIIKIDVEGVEDKVLLGMNKILSDSGDLMIAMEYLCDHRTNEAHRKATNIMIENGYYPNIIGSDGNLKPIPVELISKYFEENSLESDNFIYKRK